MADWSDFTVQVTRGDTASFDFTVTLLGAAQDITGWSLWFTAKRHVNDADNAAVIGPKTLLNGGIGLTLATAGTAFVMLVPADTAGLTEQKTTLFADLQGKDPAGDVYTLARGKLTVVADVTQAS